MMLNRPLSDPNFVKARRALQEAVDFQREGKSAQAEKAYAKTVGKYPEYFDALHFYGMFKYQHGQLEDALKLVSKATKVNPHSSNALNSRGVILGVLGRHLEALASFDAALGVDPNHPGALSNRGNSLNELRRYEDAIDSANRSLGIRPNQLEAYVTRGAAQRELKRFDDALVSYDQAIELNPTYAIAWAGRGNALSDLKWYAEALAAYDKALELKPDLEDGWLGRGNVFCILKRYEEALAAYARVLSFKPNLASAWLGRGNVLGDLKHCEEALAAFDKALLLNPKLDKAWLGLGNMCFYLRQFDDATAAYHKALASNPDLENAWLGLGTLCLELKRHNEALGAYDRALKLKPDFDMAWLGRGNVFFDLRHYDEAFAAYDKALALDPDLLVAEGQRINVKLYLCDWTDLATERRHLIANLHNKKVTTVPFAFLGISSSPEDQLECAKSWVAQKHPPAQIAVVQKSSGTHDRIRVGYVSANFHSHPVSYLTAGVFECHDEARFETFAISLGPEDNSEIRRRLKQSFDHFFDARALSDHAVASFIREAEIDILIDLNGFTEGARTNIFARRPAPIQVNYLGYPGTMGASYIDYIIADATVIPTSSKAFYSEKIAAVPDTFLPHDDVGRRISDKVPDRSEFGLPREGFVFCCFNNSYKFNPEVFEIWLRLLKKTEGSVLWLSETNKTAVHNLKTFAAARDIEPDRLIFAKRVESSADHLARHQLADLFLDTWPYNAHTTASDALWAGLPVLTRIGETFAGRVAASLLNAIGLTELITRSPEEYEQAAIELTINPTKLAFLKDQLAHKRVRAPLFNTQSFTRHLESIYDAMYQRYQAGLPPADIDVSNSVSAAVGS